MTAVGATDASFPQPDVSRTPSGARRLGIALLVIAAAQLMLLVDATITNIALPSIQSDLDVSASNLAWVVNAYLLVFGGLLLFGGRAGDLYGRRRVFQVGVALFTLASLVAGLAPNEGLLIAARILQGAGAAITAPNALALITTTFPEGKPRNSAMAVYGAMSGLGITLGVLLGGILTGYLDWRWVFLINIPIGLAVLLGSHTLVQAERHRGSLDVPSALSGTSGMLALVYGITRGGEHGWAEGMTLTAFALAAALLTVFLVLQAHTAHPMLPLHLLRDGNRAGSYAVMLLAGAGLEATFYLLTLYMQLVLRYEPVQAGLAYLPFSVGLILAAGLSSKLITRITPRLIVGPGLLIATAALFWFSTLEHGSSYPGHLMPAIFAMAFGIGATFVPLTLTAVSGVEDQESGIASAVLNTSQQIGGALGIAVLSAVATSAAENRVPDTVNALARGLAAKDSALVEKAVTALTHGYTVAFAVGGALFLTALTITMTAVNAGPQQHAPTETGQAPVG
ncbi:MFS transporter [Streptomyces sp. NPDC005811]|uniref:MFS transporter n=1 Tax=Streptomyces sp. NPDC005811 TaxID=3154565 RepID=UPI00340ACBB2